MSLTIRALRRLLGGRLRLGAMPPLSGEMLMTSGLAFDPVRVEPGEVYIDADLSSPADLRAAAAYSRGAAGVVTGRFSGEPWAGRFAIDVDDIAAALIRLIDRWPRPAPTPWMLITGSHGKSTLAGMLDRVLWPSLHARCDPEEPATLAGALAKWFCPAATCGDLVVVKAAPQPIEEAVWRRLMAGCIGRLDLGVLDRAPGDARPAPPFTLPCRAWLLSVNGRNVTFCLPRRIGGSDACPETRRPIREVRKDGRELSWRLGDRRLVLDDAPPHCIPAASLAVAAAVRLGVATEMAAQRLTGFQGVPHRFERIAIDGVTVFDDTSRVDETTLTAALTGLTQEPVAGRKTVVVAASADRFTEEAQRRSGQRAAHHGVDAVVACGQGLAPLVDAAREHGHPRTAAKLFETSVEVVAELFETIQPEDAVIVCGQPEHGAREIVEALKEKFATEPREAKHAA